MDVPRLHGYPIDQQAVAHAHAKARARQAARIEARAARRAAREDALGTFWFLRWIAA